MKWMSRKTPNLFKKFFSISFLLSLLLSFILVSFPLPFIFVVSSSFLASFMFSKSSHCFQVSIVGLFPLSLVRLWPERNLGKSKEKGGKKGKKKRKKERKNERR